MKLTDKEILKQVELNITTSSENAGGGCYIKWKGHTFEHFDCHSMLEEADRMRDYVERCIQLEKNGIQVNTNSVVWDWPKYSELKSDNEYFDLLNSINDIFHKKGEFAFMLQNGKTAFVQNGKLVSKVYIDFENGSYSHFTSKGYKYLNIGQGHKMGLSYAKTDQFLSFLKKNKIPTTI